jgi:hypothetical protein
MLYHIAYLLTLLSPPSDLSALNAFPPHTVAHANYELAREHADWILGEWTKAGVEHNVILADWLCGWSDAADWRRDVWSMLDDATNPDATVDYRRMRLAALRTALGEAAYFRGVLPGPVPLQFFRWRD